MVKAFADSGGPRWSVGIATPVGDRAGTLAAHLPAVVSVPDSVGV